MIHTKDNIAAYLETLLEEYKRESEDIDVEISKHIENTGELPDYLSKEEALRIQDKYDSISVVIQEIYAFLI